MAATATTMAQVKPILGTSLTVHDPNSEHRLANRPPVEQL